MEQFKATIYLVGASKSGKNSLMERLQQIYTTIDERYQVELEMMIPDSIKSIPATAFGVIIVYNIISADSFQFATQMVEQIIKHQSNQKTFPLRLLIGTHLDHVKQRPRDRQVSSLDAQRLSQRLGGLQYEICSQNSQQLDHFLENFNFFIFKDLQEAVKNGQFIEVVRDVENYSSPWRQSLTKIVETKKQEVKERINGYMSPNSMFFKKEDENTGQDSLQYSPSLEDDQFPVSQNAKITKRSVNANSNIPYYLQKSWEASQHSQNNDLFQSNSFHSKQQITDEVKNRFLTQKQLLSPTSDNLQMNDLDKLNEEPETEKRIRYNANTLMKQLERQKEKIRELNRGNNTDTVILPPQVIKKGAMAFDYKVAEPKVEHSEYWSKNLRYVNVHLLDQQIKNGGLYKSHNSVKPSILKEETIRIKSKLAEQPIIILDLEVQDQTIQLPVFKSSNAYRLARDFVQTNKMDPKYIKEIGLIIMRKQQEHENKTHKVKCKLQLEIEGKLFKTKIYEDETATEAAERIAEEQEIDEMSVLKVLQEVLQ
ncbi:Rab-like_protein [Hexamita inflata]|uniref:Rab-like protein n=1 Tax=Hexamita inflata TaxID=28002 RepID=A0AA86VSS2_9EUKA|nr:Rab-like protein [Hexamita inflata]